MAAARIFRFARTRRWAMAGSATRSARAISAVVRPARVRSVSATRASSGSAGWQQVKISRSRSSAIPLGSGSGGFASSTPSGVSLAACRSLAASFARLRSTSTARLRAVVVSQPPGLAGTPSRAQVFSAWANASWAHSSARSQSPVTAISVATIRPHSSRNAVSTAASTAAAPPGLASVATNVLLADSVRI